MTNEVNDIINNICDKLGCAVSDLLPEMYKFIVMKDLFLIIILLLACAAGIIGAIRCWKYAKEDFDDIIAGTFAIVLASAAIIAFVYSIIFMHDLIGWLVSSKAAMFDYIMSNLEWR